MLRGVESGKVTGPLKRGGQLKKVKVKRTGWGVGNPDAGEGLPCGLGTCLRAPPSPATPRHATPASAHGRWLAVTVRAERHRSY